MASCAASPVSPLPLYTLGALHTAGMGCANGVIAINMVRDLLKVRGEAGWGGGLECAAECSKSERRAWVQIDQGSTRWDLEAA